MCHNTGGIFLILKLSKIPLLSLKSATHPNKLFAGLFSTFCITILTFVSAGALQECLEKVLGLSQLKETAIFVISVTSS